MTVTENPAVVVDRYRNPELTRTTTPVSNCRMRPLPSKETTEIGEKVVDPWKLTAATGGRHRQFAAE